jgi:uncharacterized protein YeaO (DUF488 family)
MDVLSVKIGIKRVYDEFSPKDGLRLLVDRLWPRGIKKEDLALDAWAKEFAPSSALRIWFGHDPKNFKEFEKKYFKELDENQPLWKPLIDKYKNQKITLLYAAKDPRCNHALCLKAYLTHHFG